MCCITEMMLRFLSSMRPRWKMICIFFFFFKQSPTGLTCILFSTSPHFSPVPPSSLWQQIKQKPPGLRLNCKAAVFLCHLKVVGFFFFFGLFFVFSFGSLTSPEAVWGGKLMLDFHLKSIHPLIPSQTAVNSQQTVRLSPAWDQGPHLAFI